VCLTGLVILLAGAVGLVRTDVHDHQAYGLASVGLFVQVVACVLAHLMTVAALDTSTGTYAAYMWWKGGGGDGTRRRLRSIGRLFSGTRRTAPASA